MRGYRESFFGLDPRQSIFGPFGHGCGRGFGRKFGRGISHHRPGFEFPFRAWARFNPYNLSGCYYHEERTNQRNTSCNQGPTDKCPCRKQSEIEERQRGTYCERRGRRCGCRPDHHGHNEFGRFECTSKDDEKGDTTDVEEEEDRCCRRRNRRCRKLKRCCNRKSNDAEMSVAEGNNEKTPTVVMERIVVEEEPLSNSV